MNVTTVKDIKTVRYRPQPGERQLSINLGLAEAAIVLEFAKAHGLGFDVVQIPTGQGIEIHALLLSDTSDTSPFGNDLSDLLDELSTRINPNAIRHVWGRLQAA